MREGATQRWLLQCASAISGRPIDPSPPSPSAIHSHRGRSGKLFTYNYSHVCFEQEPALFEPSRHPYFMVSLLLPVSSHIT
jgi:hypothetical protein